MRTTFLHFGNSWTHCDEMWCVGTGFHLLRNMHVTQAMNGDTDNRGGGGLFSPFPSQLRLRPQSMLGLSVLVEFEPIDKVGLLLTGKRTKRLFTL